MVVYVIDGTSVCRVAATGKKAGRVPKLAQRLTQIDSTSNIMLARRVNDLQQFGSMYHRCANAVGASRDWRLDEFNAGRAVVIEVHNFANYTLDYFSYFENVTFAWVLGVNRLFIVTDKYTFEQDVMQYYNCVYHNSMLYGQTRRLVTNGWLYFLQERIIYENYSS